MSEFRRGLRDSTPVLIGLVPAALMLGAQAATKGISTLAVPLMTGLNFAGGSEFAAVGLWTSPPHLLLIVGGDIAGEQPASRHGRGPRAMVATPSRRRALPALFLMVDESWAMALADAKSRPSPRTIAVLDTAPGCVLIAVIAPVFVTGRLADLLALAVTLVAAARLPLLPTVILGVGSAWLARVVIG